MKILNHYVILICCLLISTIVIANDTIKLSIGQWSFDDLNAQNLIVDMTLTTKGLGFSASADSVKLAQPIGRLSQFKLSCKELLIVSENISCARGHIGFHQKDLGLQKLSFEVEAMPENEKYKIEVENINVASALFSATFIIKKDKWKVFADTPQVQFSSLMSFLSSYMEQEQLETLANWNLVGDLKLDVDLSGHADQLNGIELDLETKVLNVSDSDGRYVTEGVSSTLSLKVNKTEQEWQWDVALNSTAGQGYAEPIFIDFSETPVIIKAQGSWLQEQAKLHINTAELTHGTIAQVNLSGIASLEQINTLTVDVKKADISKLYSSWIQPFAVGMNVDDLDLSGNITFHYQLQGDGNYDLSMDIEQIFIGDLAGRFGVDNLSGTVAWSNYDKVQNLELNWKSASLYAIPLGSSNIKAETHHSSLILQQPWILPILDGELQINDFSLHNLGDEHLKWTFAGKLSPISMGTLSTALEWPLMHGKVSGVIPNVSYSEQRVKVDGALKVNLFEGITTIRDLQLDQPFGALPQLKANIDMRNLNLETLTQTFDFGRITGKLDGELTNFRLSNWRPVNFDAKFATPEGDKSRRKISQKAVDNLSQIGGGATGVLQRSFLRFFDEFSYQRLGLSCKLRNEICEMSGVSEAKQGYYIVKGGGLPPRINVVGYTRRVDWPDLIERLKAVSNSSGAVVQ